MRRWLLRWAFGPWVLVVSAIAPAGRARAEAIIQLDATANVVSSAASPDYPFEHAVQARPGLMLQLGTPRLVWRAGYALAYDRALEGGTTISHQADLGLAAEPTRRTMLTVGAGFTRGETTFRLGRPPADAGRPEFMDQGGGVLVTGTARQTLSWEATSDLRLGQELQATQVARPDALEDGNATVVGRLRLDRLLTSDSVGIEAGARFASLRPMEAPTAVPHLETWTFSLSGAWNRDFDDRWSGQLTAGMELLRNLALASNRLNPAASLTLRHTAAAGVAAITASHAVLPMLETGTISESDELVLHLTRALDPDRRRVLSGSAGFVHTRPPATGAIEASPGNALRGDLGLTWIFTRHLLAMGRYSVAHQFWKGTTSTVHVLLMGVTFNLGNAEQVPPIPVPGQRVDRSDAVGFHPEASRP